MLINNYKLNLNQLIIYLKNINQFKYIKKINQNIIYKMVDRVKEENISTSPEPISLKITEKIIEQMKNNSICKIINHFSCKILSRLIFDISSIFSHRHFLLLLLLFLLNL